MNAYCKHCHRTHAAWTRLNDGYICGRCLARDRDPLVKPISTRDAGRIVSVKALDRR
jgi:hypothetical protein